MKYEWNGGTTDVPNYIPRDFTLSAYSKNDLKIYLNKTITDGSGTDYTNGGGWDRYTSSDVLYQQKLYTDGKFASTIFEEFTDSDFVQGRPKPMVFSHPARFDTSSLEGLYN